MAVGIDHAVDHVRDSILIGGIDVLVVEVGQETDIIVARTEIGIEIGQEKGLEITHMINIGQVIKEVGQKAETDLETKKDKGREIAADQGAEVGQEEDIGQEVEAGLEKRGKEEGVEVGLLQKGGLFHCSKCFICLSDCYKAGGCGLIK